MKHLKQLAVAGLLFLGGIVAGVAGADEYSYSAVAGNSEWAFGYATGRSSQQAADNDALSWCHEQNRGQCYIEYRASGPGCIALAEDGDGAGGWGASFGYSNDRSAARNRALNECNSRSSSGCYVVDSGCTDW